MEVKRILVPVDLSDRSGQELRWASEFAKNFGAEVLTIHVIPERAMESSLQHGQDWEGLRRDITARLNALAAEAARGAGFERLSHTPHVVAGDPAEEILDAVERERCQMIVISTHGRSGLPHALMGSVAEKVVRLSPVPVLTLSQAGMSEAA